MKKLIVMLAMVGSMMFSVAAFAGGININAATSEQLQEVKGIGPKTADAIVAYRDEYGKFANLESLTAVKGIGDKKLAKIQDSLTVEASKE
ncbi:MAG: helix-hairpin-helix domain-containing protein [Mariprofundaceae bacterium]|nr:helix-hairpin-helix domain-containing protein [Mariprofundaceae bacterium]